MVQKRDRIITEKELKSENIGVEGFEPPTSCSQSRRATRLRYTPLPSIERHHTAGI